MLNVAHQNRTGGRQEFRQAGDKIAVQSAHSQDEMGHYVGLTVQTNRSFVSRDWIRLLRAASALLAISAVLLLAVSAVLDLYRSKTCSLYLSLPLYARTAASSFPEVFQVYPPVLTVTPEGVLEITDGSSNGTVVGSDRPACMQTLAAHSFALSYGRPFVGDYSPPSCAFNRVTWNLTVTSAGRQFDRLGIVYLNDIEVFRTSTAEPTTTGIKWTYLKDMTSFLSLLEKDQKVIFDLGNLVNDVYTAAFNVTLTASYFTADDTVTAADLILPVSPSNADQDQPSVFQVPPDTASSTLTLPRNVKKAIFTIAATGQIEEEFWWSNVLQSDINTFPDYGTLYGYSPFREVQLLIDGRLAGVAWPNPVVFTGGIVPGLWRPVVGIDAFDLKEDEIDITPWLPVLCDGESHRFEIRISGLNDNGDGTAVLSSIDGSYWLITGKVFIWLDVEGHITHGNGPYQFTPPPEFRVSSEVGTSLNGTNDTLLYEVHGSRTLSFDSTIELSQVIQLASWRQHLSYSNVGNFSNGANVEVNTQVTSGIDVSSSGYARQFTYPLYSNSVVGYEQSNYTIRAAVDLGKDVKTLGESVFPTGLESVSVAQAGQERLKGFQGAWLSTRLWGDATYLANETAKKSFSFGTTEQEMSFYGINAGYSQSTQTFPTLTGNKELFHRYVKALNGSILEDDESLIGLSVQHDYSAQLRHDSVFCLPSMPGRGNYVWVGNGSDA